MSARDDVLSAAEALAAASSDGTFSVEDVVGYLRRRNSQFAESTIRTHVTSRMCANAPDNHTVVSSDLVRIAPGRYALNR